MPTPLDTRIVQDNRAIRAVERHNAANAPQRTPLPDRATIAERLADHGDDSGREARKKLADELHEVVTQVRRIRANPTLNAAEIEPTVADAVRSRVDRLLAECEEQGRVIDTMEQTVEQAIDDALRPERVEWVGLATEFRAALLDMTDEQRAAFVQRLEGTRHMPLLRYAVASVPPELSGVSLGMHHQIYTTQLAIKDPTLLHRPQDLKLRRAALEKTKDGIRRTAAELVDMEQADALRALTEQKP